MTDRKFTPPTEFPAEYVDGNGNKAVILGRGPNKLFPFIGHNAAGHARFWTAKGVDPTDYMYAGNDLHDIPKRITTWHNVYANWVGPQCSNRSDADETDRELGIMNRLCVYRIERDEDGGNHEMFKEEV